MDARMHARTSAGLLMKAALSLLAFAASRYRATLFGTEDDVTAAMADLRWVDENVLR